MSNSHPPYTKQDQQALALAYLSYLGESIDWKLPHIIAEDVMNLIHNNIPNVPVLCNGTTGDWQIVWGPSFEFDLPDEKQENMIYVAQQISDPTNYMVVLRGTNFDSLLDWLDDDFDVKNKTYWVGPNGESGSYGSISDGTNNYMNAILNVTPEYTVKGSGTIVDFLSSITNQQITITFCGHSLAGGTSPVLALYFAQLQGQQGSWDPNSNATISVVTFAGPTPGDASFASYLASIIPNSSFTRYHDTNDVVPLAWNIETFNTIPTLYPTTGSNAVQGMTGLENKIYGKLQQDIENNNYAQMGTSTPFTFPVYTSGFAKGNSFGDQVAYQHHYSYPSPWGLNVPEVISILANNK